VWPQPDPDESWRSWLGGMCVRLRRALLAHRDGARVIAIAQLSTKMAAFSELAMSTLVARGLPLHRARVIVLTAERFTVGFVLEEQTGLPTVVDANVFDLDSYAKAYPTVIAGVTEYFEPGRTVDDLFADCLALIIGGESELVAQLGPKAKGWAAWR
jgi:Tetracyclin repressor-like, C-terminal domain